MALLDLRDRNAGPDKSPCHNRMAIQATVNEVIRDRRGQIGAFERYPIDAPIVVNTHGDLTGVTWVGAGRRDTGLVQMTPDADVLVFGATCYAADDPRPGERSIYNAIDCGIRDMGLWGGRMGLRLNNALGLTMRDVLIEGNYVGLWTEGQCEGLLSSNLHIDGSAFASIIAGNLNDGDPNLNNGDFQKNTFRTTRLSPQTTAGVCMRIAAGQRPSDGSYSGQFVSGYIVFDDLQIVDGPPTLIDLDHVAMGITFKHFNNERNVALFDPHDPAKLPQNNVFSMIRQGPGCGDLVMEDALLTGQDSGPGTTRWKYIIEQQSGTFYDTRSKFDVSGRSGTAALHLGGNGGDLKGSTLWDAASVQVANGATATLQGVRLAVGGFAPDGKIIS